MTKIRKPPRWVAPFLRALERGGDVRRAARDVGVDFTTAYARRKAHTDFAEAWAGALERFAAAKKEVPGDAVPSPSRGFAAGFQCSPAPRAGSALQSLSLEGRGAELALQPTAGGARVARPGAGRWNAAAEKRFFAALADRANVRAAAAAAGFSTNAIYARRTKRPSSGGCGKRRSRPAWRGC